MPAGVGALCPAYLSTMRLAPIMLLLLTLPLGCAERPGPDAALAARLIGEHLGEPVTVLGLEPEPGGLWRVRLRRGSARSGAEGAARLRHWDGRWRVVDETSSAERLRLL